MNRAGSISERSSWQVPRSAEFHALGTDGVSRRIVCGGVPYPCQVIFLTSQVRSFRQTVAKKDLLSESRGGVDEPFVMVEDAGCWFVRS